MPNSCGLAAMRSRAARAPDGQERDVLRARLERDLQRQRGDLRDGQLAGLDRAAELLGEAERLEGHHREGQLAQHPRTDEKIHLDRAQQRDGVEVVPAGADELSHGGHRVVGEPPSAERDGRARRDEPRELLEVGDLVDSLHRLTSGYRMSVRSWTEGPIAHVQLARPAARNALDRPTIAELHAAVRDAAAGNGVRCLVLSGEGESFCAGGDLHAVRTQTVAETVALNDELLAVIDQLEGLAVPSVAALHGHVLGGGLELALGCTLRVADADARLGLPEPRIGLIPGSGGMARLPHLIPPGAALRLLLTGETIGGDEALALDLVQVCAPAGEALAEATALASRITENGPLAVRTILDVVRRHHSGAVQAAIADGVERLPAILASADLREGVEAFAERRTPDFRGR